MTRLPQKRLMAALLPLSFLWVFVACLSICERETLAMHPPTDLVSSTDISEVERESDCGGCPLSYFPTATAPERDKGILVFDSVSGFAPVIPSIASSYHFSESLNRPFLKGRPPLTLLSTLRI